MGGIIPRVRVEPCTERNLSSHSPPRHILSMARRASSPSSPPSLKTAKPPWITVNRYLADEMSTGPLEVARGEARRYDSLDGDVLTLLALLRANGSNALRRVACLPNFRLCLFAKLGAPNQLVARRSEGSRRCPSAPPGYELKLDVRAGVLVTGLDTLPKLWLPARFKEALHECSGKRFLVANFGLHTNSNLTLGHANALIFDLKHHIIERFEPSGRRHDRHDSAVKTLFHRLLPGWDYVGSSVAPVLGAQDRADAFEGLCVTFSLMFTLLRLLNPQRTAAEINAFMVRGSSAEIRERALRLNRFMLDTLRTHPRGSLR